MTADAIPPADEGPSGGDAPVVDDVLFHLVTANDWDRCCEGALYRPDSLATEGFVHLSDAQQVVESARRWFDGVDDLMVLELDAGALGDDVVWEDTSGHGAHPHLYGPLPLAAVRSIAPWRHV